MYAILLPLSLNTHLEDSPQRNAHDDTPTNIKSKHTHANTATEEELLLSGLEQLFFKRRQVYHRFSGDFYEFSHRAILDIVSLI